MQRPDVLWSRALGVVMVTLFLGAMVPNLFILAPRFLGARGYDEGDIGMVMSAFNLTSLLFLPLVAPTIARLGHARTLSLGCLVTSIGAALFVLVDTKAGFAAARGLQGIGFSFVLVGAGAYVADIAPITRLGQALGVSGVLTLAAQAVGPALGEEILAFGWTAVFAVAVGCGLAGAVVALAIPRVRYHGRETHAPPTSALAILGATALAGLGFGTIWTFLADYTRQLGIARTSWFFTPYVIAAISTRLLLGRFFDRMGRKATAVPALAGHAVILLMMARVGAPWQLVVIGLVYGLCHGFYYPTLQAMIVERSGGERSRAIVASTFAFGLGVIVAGLGLGQVAHAWGYAAIYPIASAAGVVAVVLVVTGDPRKRP